MNNDSDNLRMLIIELKRFKAEMLYQFEKAKDEEDD